MVIHIDGVPEYLTREQYASIFEAVGFTPGDVIEMRMAHDGIHALVFARDNKGEKIINRDGAQKNRVFVPVRHPSREDRSGTTTTRTTPVAGTRLAPSLTEMQVVYWVSGSRPKNVLFGPTFDRKASWAFADESPEDVTVFHSYLEPKGDVHWARGTV